jgi:hypothetical protein
MQAVVKAVARLAKCIKFVDQLVARVECVPRVKLNALATIAVCAILMVVMEIVRPIVAGLTILIALANV